MKVIGGAIQATQITFNENSEQETCAYFVSLREHILEPLTCIFSAVRGYFSKNCPHSPASAKNADIYLG